MKTIIINSQNLNQYDDIIWYRKQKGFRKPGLVYQYSQKEILEYAKCYNDPIYFIEKYCEIITHEGYKKIKLYEYQIELINHIKENRFSIINHVRQAGTTTVLNLLILHSLIFKGSSTVRFDFKKDVSIIKIEQIKGIYSRLPFFLQPGVLKNDATVFRLENGALLHAKYSTGVTLGMNYDEYYLDGYGYYENQESLYKSLIPSISARTEGKMIITSTGGDFFNHLFNEAKNNLNAFEPFEIRWFNLYKRSEFDKLRNMIGDEDSFKREYLLK